MTVSGMTATDHPERYTTVRRRGVFELEVKRSRFIGVCVPLKDEREATNFLTSMRENYPEARHYVYAWRLDHPQQLQKYTDDGEPQGTAGLPVLDVLIRAHIDRGALCVVRYFGGVLLGTGGLLRAYSRSASGALEAAEPVVYKRSLLYALEIPYHQYDLVRHRLELAGFYLEEPTFASAVTLRIGATASQRDVLHALIRDLTAGNGNLIPVGETYLPENIVLN